jgi:hypothetical protein
MTFFPQALRPLQTRIITSTWNGGKRKNHTMKSAAQPKSKTLLILVTLVFLCFGLLSRMQAVVPAPDGGYPGGNTAEGTNALLSLTTGTYNTAIGLFSLRSSTEGKFNTAVGAGALLSITTTQENTAIGAGALLVSTSGFNTATGAFALFENDTGGFNTANGDEALFSNTTGSNNTATGGGALVFNTAGNQNTADGFQALRNNLVGVGNTATGYQALSASTGNSNIGLGAGAGSSLTTGNNNIDIGNSGFTGESDTIRIGNTQTKTFIAGIRDVTVGVNGIPVVIDSAGQLGTIVSSKLFKKEIQPMDKTSEAILSLKPVTFYYKSDSKNTPQFGLIAEEVATVNPDLVVRDKNGEIYTVRYDAVNAMLLNEFLKAHRKVEKLERAVADLVATVREQAAQIQKVSAQVEMKKAAPQLVMDNP